MKEPGLVVARAFNRNAWEAEVGLCREFQARQGFDKETLS